MDEKYDSLLDSIMSILDELGNLIKSIQYLQLTLKSQSAQSHIKNMIEMQSKIINDGITECDGRLEEIKREYLDEITVKKYDIIILKLKTLKSQFALPSPKSAKTFVEIFNKDGMFNAIEYMSLDDVKNLASALSVDASGSAYMREFSEYIGRYANHKLISDLGPDELDMFNAWLLSRNNKHILENFINRDDITKESLVKIFQHALFKFDLDITDTSESGLQDHYEESGLKTLFDSGKVATISMWLEPRYNENSVIMELVNTPDLFQSWKFQALLKLLSNHNNIPRKFLSGLISILSPENNNELLMRTVQLLRGNMQKEQHHQIVMDALVDNGHTLALISKLFMKRYNQSIYYLFSDKGITDGFNGPIQDTRYVDSDTTTEYPSLIHALTNMSLFYMRSWKTHNNISSILQIVKFHGADLNIVDTDGRTALMAILAGVTDIIKTGDIFNLCLRYGNLSIQFSDIENVLFMTNQLILNGIDLNVVDNYGDTALTLACRNLPSGITECKIIKALILSGSNINHADQEGNTSLHLLAKGLTQMREQFLSNSSCNVMQSEDEANVNNPFAMNQDDFITPNIVLLLDLDANKNTKNTAGETPLSLLENGLNTVPNNIRTELMQAYTKIFNPSENEPVYMLGIESYKTNAYVNDLGYTVLHTGNPDRYINRFLLDLVQNPENIEQLSTCPITHNIFKEPVITPSGYTYEASAIAAWIKEHHTDPTTRQSLNMNQLGLNKIARKIIFEYNEYGSDLRSKYFYSTAYAAKIDQNLLEQTFNSQTNASKLQHLACLLGITPNEFSIEDDNSIDEIINTKNLWYESVTYKTDVIGSYEHINDMISKFYCSSKFVSLLAVALKESYPSSTIKTIIDLDKDKFASHYVEIMKLLHIYLNKVRDHDIENAKIIMKNCIDHNPKQFFKNVMDLYLYENNNPKNFHDLFVNELDRFGNSFVDIAIELGARADLDGVPHKGIISLYLNIMEKLLHIQDHNLIVNDFLYIYDSKVIEKMSKVGCISDTNSEGRTLLSKLCMFRPHISKLLEQFKDVLPILLKHGLDINHQDKFGMTALHLILDRNTSYSDVTTKCVEMLIKSGADPRIEDNNGKLPLDYAESSIDDVDYTESSIIKEMLLQKCDSLNNDDGYKPGSPSP